MLNLKYTAMTGWPLELVIAFCFGALAARSHQRSTITQLWSVYARASNPFDSRNHPHTHAHTFEGDLLGLNAVEDATTDRQQYDE